jgi:diguanylate cyclase (GGDEF)-like protein
MSISMKHEPSASDPKPGIGVPSALIAFGLMAPIATYVIAVSSISPNTKIALLVALSLVYLIICVWTMLQMRKSKSHEALPTPRSVLSDEDELELKLAGLEEAREFFGTSLKPADLFRLASNRISEIVPFETAILIVKDSETETLRIIQSFGSNARDFDALGLPMGESVAGLAFLSSEVEVTNDLGSERDVFPDGLLSSYGAAAAVPLNYEGETFATLQLLFVENELAAGVTKRLQMIGERIGPLFLGSMAFERSLSNALTDPLTRLPNERAFLMVLENQLAESQRFRDERPLTVLAIDLKDFEEVNRDHGHALGDRALSFAAEKIASQLRRMDFLARSINDEFLVVLPKASERTALEITGRIQRTLAGSPMSISDGETMHVRLNFGLATFWKDGETPQQLVQTANSRKQQAKSEDPGNLLVFPKEYVN